MLPFLPQNGNKPAQPRGKICFAEDFLSGERFAHEVLRDEVPEHRRVVHFADRTGERLGQFDPARNKTHADVLQFRAQFDTENDPQFRQKFDARIEANYAAIYDRLAKQLQSAKEAAV